MTSGRDILLRKRWMREYLDQLSLVSGRDVVENEIRSVEEAKSTREKAKKFASLPRYRQEFLLKNNEIGPLRHLFTLLERANPAPISVWTDHTIDCGTFTLPNILSVDLTFLAKWKYDSVIVFLSSDLSDRVILDFDQVYDNGISIVVETQGKNWHVIG